jgi:hypothetical protein
MITARPMSDLASDLAPGSASGPPAEILSGGPAAGTRTAHQLARLPVCEQRALLFQLTGEQAHVHSHGARDVLQFRDGDVGLLGALHDEVGGLRAADRGRGRVPEPFALLGDSVPLGLPGTSDGEELPQREKKRADGDDRRRASQWVHADSVEELRRATFVLLTPASSEEFGRTGATGSTRRHAVRDVRPPDPLTVPRDAGGHRLIRDARYPRPPGA